MKKNKQVMSKKLQRAIRKRRILILKMVIFNTAVVLLIVGLVRNFAGPKVVRELRVEAGSELPEAADFLKRDYKEVELISGLDDSVDMNAVADYPVAIRVSGKDYTSVLHVVDTVEPVVTTKETEAFAGVELPPETFVEDVQDATGTEVTYAEEPDFSKEGAVEVRIRVTDEGGNSVELPVQVTVVTDTEPPVISGVEELTITAGSSVSYKKNVTVTDNYDTDVDLTVDNSTVDLNTEGDYSITYVARDAAGNETRVPTILHVGKASVETATEELVNAKADELLAQITTEDMSEKEKAKAIFSWVHESISYSDHTPKTDWIQGAYRGLVEQKGDCYVYAMTSKCLLTRAGIKNMDIEKIPSKTRHYWNLIDLGEGWYHFDATRRKDGSSFFYVTDEELMEYSNSHNGSHNYDPDDYPEIQ